MSTTTNQSFRTFVGALLSLAVVLAATSMSRAADKATVMTEAMSALEGVQEKLEQISKGRAQHRENLNLASEQAAWIARNAGDMAPKDVETGLAQARHGAATSGDGMDSLSNSVSEQSDVVKRVMSTVAKANAANSVKYKDLLNEVKNQMDELARGLKADTREARDLVELIDGIAAAYQSGSSGR